jgi:hypothetical protein
MRNCCQAGIYKMDHEMDSKAATRRLLAMCSRNFRALEPGSIYYLY